MNEESIESSSESVSVREVAVTGQAIEGAISKLRSIEPAYPLEGRTLNDLERDIFRATRLAGKAETPEEEKSLLDKADALQKIAIHSRPNNSILEVEKDDQGKETGLRIGIREMP